MTHMADAVLIHATRFEQGQNSGAVFIEAHGDARLRLTMNFDIVNRADSVVRSEVWTSNGWTEAVVVFPHDKVLDSIYIAIKYADATAEVKRAKQIRMSDDAAFHALAGLLRTTTLAVATPSPRAAT